MDEINNNDVGKRINHIRLSLGLTQEAFGETLGETPKSTVSTWENGNNLPNKERLKNIAALGGISVSYLLYGVEDDSSFGERIKSRRKDLDLSKKDLGKQVGVDKQVISQFEDGELEPSIENIAALAKALNVDAIELTANSDIDNTDVSSLLHEINKKIDLILEKLD